MKKLSSEISAQQVISQIVQGIQSGVPQELKRMPDKVQSVSDNSTAIDEKVYASATAYCESIQDTSYLYNYDQVHSKITTLCNEDEKLIGILSWNVFDRLSRKLYEENATEYVTIFRGCPHFQSEKAAKYFGTHVARNMTLNETADDRIDEGLLNWFKKFYNWVISLPHKYTFNNKTNRNEYDEKPKTYVRDTGKSKPEVDVKAMQDISRDWFRRKVEGAEKGDLITFHMDPNIYPSDKRKMFLVIGDDIGKLSDHEFFRDGKHQYVNNVSTREFSVPLMVYPIYAGMHDYPEFDSDHYGEENFPPGMKYWKPQNTTEKIYDYPVIPVEYIVWAERNYPQDIERYLEGFRRYQLNNNHQYMLEHFKEIQKLLKSK